MDILLSHTSALELIRDRRAECYFDEKRDDCPDLSSLRMSSVDRVEGLVAAVPGLNAPVHLLVASQNSRHVSRDMVSHLAFDAYPPGSFVYLGDGVCCASPELVALQMAEYATELELLLLVDELCGYYSLNRHEKFGLLQRRRPITTIDKIKGYVGQFERVRGSAKLRRVLDRVREGSGSPMESKTVHRLEFSPAHGGYGLKVVALNDPVEVLKLDGLLGERGIRVPDIILLPLESKGSEKLAFRAVSLDYKGICHRGFEKVVSDDTRRNELLSVGFKPYEIEARHYNSLNYMDGLAKAIRQDLGLPEVKLAPDVDQKRRLRRQQLYLELDRASGYTWTERSNPLVMTGALDSSGVVCDSFSTQI